MEPDPKETQGQSMDNYTSQKCDEPEPSRALGFCGAPPLSLLEAGSDISCYYHNTPEPPKQTISKSNNVIEAQCFYN